jgi:azurin
MARALACAVLAAAALGAVPAAAHAPARLMVQADEHSLVLSRQSIARGPALIQLLNRGEDPHDLKLRRAGGPRVVSFPELGAGELAQRKLRLRTGRYRLWCSLPGHRALGMRAQLRVRSRR